ncbi:molybdate ABC transporter substrate-binding protein [Agarivorans albus]
MKKLLSKLCVSWVLLVVATLKVTSLQAAEIKVAVAANFYKPVLALVDHYQKETGHHVQVSAGSTGKLYAQIKNGAPFEVFLAADQQRPSLLVDEGLAEPKSQFTYALGSLVLWSNNPELVDGKGEILKEELKHIAICNPKTAPYGAAAVSAMKNLGVYNELKPKFVEGQSVGQTYQQISSGAVDLGFVALSQVLVDKQLNGGSLWLVPNELYSPINQDAVLLKQGTNNAAAKQFLAYLQTEQSKQLIKDFGYDVK